MKNKKAFTLIEMLIVVVIIGILAAALVPRLKTAQERARDTQRHGDIKNIYTALMLYYSDVGDIPMSHCNFVGCHISGGIGNIGNPNAVESSSGSGGILTGLVPNYLTKQPVDPKNTNGYAYLYYNMGAQDVSFVRTVCSTVGQGTNVRKIAEIDYTPENITSHDFLRGCPGNTSWDQLYVAYGGNPDPKSRGRGLWLFDGQFLGFQQN